MIPSNFREIQRLSKSGGTSCYLCEEIETKKRVVLKMISHNKGTKEQFKREANLMKQLSENCLYVIKIDRHFSLKDSYVIVMEPGVEDLFTHINKHGTLSELQARSYFFYIAQALQYLHSQRIIHYDVKLENIVIMKDGKTKLIDFGLCEKLPSNSNMSTLRRGSIKYMAPEIVCMKPHTMKVDVWSLGVSIFAALTNYYPFEGENEYTYTSSVLSCQPDVSLLQEKKITNEFMKLIKQMLEKKAENRISIEEIVKFPWL